MLDRELRRMRDRKFVPYILDKHWLRAFTIFPGSWSVFDLFPPIKGYKASPAKKKTYYVSRKLQHRDWVKLVKERDGAVCKKCGSSEKLEAHHIWAQQSFYLFRYILKNGITLCRACHYGVDSNFEITPNQFKWLTQECNLINSHIERDNFWEYWVSGIGKCRLMLFNALPDDVDVSSEELHLYLTGGYGIVQIAHIKEAAQSVPCPDFDLELNEEMIEKIKNCSPW